MQKNENPILKTLLSHRSIRTYKSDPLPEGLLEKLIECGLRSSSSGNMQTWSVIATSHPELKEKLFVAHSEQPMIRQAPLVLTFCADLRRTQTWLEASQAATSFDDLSGFMVGAVDAVIAAQSICVAAESEGLGICYMGTTLWCPDKISEILNLPTQVMPVTSIVLGYPDENPELRDRLPLTAILHQDTYQDFSAEEIRTVYKDREVKGWKRYMDYSGMEATIRAAGINNLGQFYTSQFKYSKKLFAETSVRYLQVLKDKGFWNF